MSSPSTPMTFQLSPDTLVLFEMLQERHGVARKELLVLALVALAERDGVPIPSGLRTHRFPRQPWSRRIADPPGPIRRRRGR